MINIVTGLFLKENLKTTMIEGVQKQHILFEMTLCCMTLQTFVML